MSGTPRSLVSSVRSPARPALARQALGVLRGSAIWLAACLAWLPGHGSPSSAAETDSSPAAAAPARLRVYIGTYTQGKSEGIYRMELELDTGNLSAPVLAGKTVNPSFLAIHPGRRHLYAVGEIGNFEGKKTGAVSAFALDSPDGQLTLLNQQPSGGTGPCHVVVDGAGRHVLVANYGSGSIAALPIRDDGGLAPASSVVQHAGASVDPRRQQGPHAHSINVDAANRFVFAADLGLDKLLIYRWDAGRGLLAPSEPAFAAVAPGSGPRHFALHPGGRYAYVINELKSTVAAFAYDAARGSLQELQMVSTLPESFQGPNTTAEVQVHPSGRFLYGSNRGHDSIAVWAIDPQTGRLAAVEHESTQGKTPRNFGIDPTGRYLLAANQGSDSIVAFRIDLNSGGLEPTGQRVEVGMPVCIKMMPLPE